MTEEITSPRFRIGQQVIIGDDSPIFTIEDIKNGDGKYLYKFSGNEELYPEDSLKIPSPVWQWSSLSDAYKLKSPITYVVQNILILPSLNIFYGEPGTLKTMFVMDLAMCVVSGKGWLSGSPDKPNTGYQSKKSPILWIDVDNGQDLIERRFKAIGQTQEVPEDSEFHYISFPPFALNDSESVKELIQAIDYYQAKLIVFDNLGTISGGMDENTSQMIGIMGVLREIAEKTQSAVIVIHHTSKAGSLRGHSSINAAVDLALLIERDSNAVTIHTTKTRHALIQPFSALWTCESEKGELVSGRFFGLGQVEKDTPKDKVEIAESQIMLGLEDGMNQSEVIKMMKGKAGRDTTRQALKNLTSSGKLHVQKSGHKNSKGYYLNDNV